MKFKGEKAASKVGSYKVMSGVNQFLVLSRVKGGIILSLKVSASGEWSYPTIIIEF